MGEEKNNNTKSDHSMNTKDFMIGTLVGALVGAAAALLLSPKSGQELRSDLADSYQNATKKTQKIAKNVGEQTEHIVGKVKETLDSITNDIQEWRNETQHAMGNTQNTDQNAVEETMENTATNETNHGRS